MPTPPVPGQPHPDTDIIMAVLREIAPGQVQPYEVAAKAVGLDPADAVFKRRAATARNRLRRERVNIAVVTGQGFLRETAQQSLANYRGRTRKGIARKTRRAGETLANIDAAQLSKDERAELFAESTINAMIGRTAGHDTKKKVLAAVKVAEQRLPMQKALEVLQNGK